MEQITLRISENTLESLEGEADEHGRSRSEHIRDILESRHEIDELRTEHERVVSELREEIADLERQLDNRNDVVGTLRERLENREQRIDDLEEQLARRSQIEEKVVTSGVTPGETLDRQRIETVGLPASVTVASRRYDAPAILC